MRLLGDCSEHNVVFKGDDEFGFKGDIDTVD